MSIKQSFILAIKSLSSSKMRSLLTMLGIIIGVASVIVLVSLVNGLKSEMVDMFQSMGTNLISVNITGRGGNRAVSVSDIMDFAEENADLISLISPSVTTSVTLKNDTESLTTTCTGTNEMYPDIKKITVDQGRYIEYVEVEKRQKVCVIGTYTASELFGTKAAVGKTLKINGETYSVIGVFEETADGEEGSSDDAIYIPYTLATSISWMRGVNSYVLSARSEGTVDGAMDKLESYFLSIFGSTDYFNIMSQQEMMDQMDEMTGMMTSVLVGIAGISLLVGDIGIMNIMLVSVTERTREIGIRKSLGAAPWDIMSQFVVEAATTSACGGVIGIVFGIAAAYAAGKIMDMSVKPSFGAVAVAFGVSVGIGIIFGYFPAKKASRLSPIEALRYD